MELIFKKYHKSEQHTEKIYLIYDPAQNPTQFTADVFRSISNRNFIQGCENLLIGPIIKDKKMTVRVLNSDGTETKSNSEVQKIFEAYLNDQGYTSTYSSITNIQEFGTVYHFTA